MVEKSCASKSWKTSPISPAILLTGLLPASTPFTSTTPSRSPRMNRGTSPFRQFARVDFPAPLGPIITTNSPLFTSKSTDFNADAPPLPLYEKESPLVSTAISPPIF